MSNTTLERVAKYWMCHQHGGIQYYGDNCLEKLFENQREPNNHRSFVGEHRKTVSVSVFFLLLTVCNVVQPVKLL